MQNMGIYTRGTWVYIQEDNGKRVKFCLTQL